MSTLRAWIWSSGSVQADRSGVLLPKVCLGCLFVSLRNHAQTSEVSSKFEEFVHAVNLEIVRPNPCGRPAAFAEFHLIPFRP